MLPVSRGEQRKPAGHEQHREMGAEMADRIEGRMPVREKAEHERDGKTSTVAANTQ